MNKNCISLTASSLVGVILFCEILVGFDTMRSTIQY